MRKIFFGKLICLFAVFSFVGCQKDFLSKEGTEYLSKTEYNQLSKESSAFASRSTKDFLGGIYKAFAYQEELFRNNHDEFDFRSDLCALDIYGEDAVQGIFWYNVDYLHNSYTPTDRRPSVIWSRYYNIIASANTLLSELVPSDPADWKGDMESMIGEAHILRAVAYYMLVNVFGKPYTVDGGASLGVPLALPGDLSAVKKRATVKEVYDQIKKDLEMGLEHVGEDVGISDKTRVGKPMAHFLLAKINMEMGKYAEAEKEAAAGLIGYDVAHSFPEAASYGYSDLNASDAVWGYDINSETTMLFASPFSTMLDNSLKPSYSTKLRGYNWLVEHMGDGDRRLNEWFGPGFASPEDPDAKAFNMKWGGTLDGYYIPYISTKFYSPAGHLGDYIYYRYADLYLLKVEAMQMGGKDAEAQAALNEFVKVRDAAYNCAKTGDELRDEIRIQRRLELWMDGVSWFDARRWRIGMDRSKPGKSGESNHSEAARGISVPAEYSDFYIFQIPQKQISIEPGLEQNPIYVPGK